MEQNRIIGFDIIKSLAIFFVVIYHFGCVDFGKFDGGGGISLIPPRLSMSCLQVVFLYFLWLMEHCYKREGLDQLRLQNISSCHISIQSYSIYLFSQH